MKNFLSYALMLYIFAIFQTVIFPDFFFVISQIIAKDFFLTLTIDLYYLMIIYFSFNRSFLKGLTSVIMLYFIEEGLGFSWIGVQIPIFLTTFLVIQVLKVHFVFHTRRAVGVVVFILIFVENISHYRLGLDQDFPIIFIQYGFSALSSSLIHAWVGGYLFEILTAFDAKTLYRFETQRTLFPLPIRSL
ncbi:MAG: hypothetical protein KDD46_01955 [Bdellovibrionales bacterium]|nr:hypothetical protein [Bdellovibrionales bacterium]